MCKVNIAFLVIGEVINRRVIIYVENDTIKLFGLCWIEQLLYLNNERRFNRLKSGRHVIFFITNYNDPKKRLVG